MRIAIDATPLICSTGGIRRYVVELTRALASSHPEDELFLLTDQAGWPLPAELQEFSNISVPTPHQQPFRGKWWSIGLPLALLRNRIDVFHGSDFAVPYVPLRPSVLVVHDLSPWKEPPLRAAGAERVRQRTPFLFRIATLLVTPSEAVKRELAAEFQIAPAKIRVTPLAAGDEFCHTPDTNISVALQRVGITRPYLFAIAGPQPRKNVDFLLEAWQAARLFVPDLDLVCVGPLRECTIKTYGHAGLHVFSSPGDQELQTLLSGAVAFVYPSLYEGFGIPVLEAMQNGVPVITSQDAAISEVAGGAALQIDATDVRALQHAIVDVATNAPLRSDLKAKGIQRSSQYSWRVTASLTRQTYVEAIGRF